MVAIRMSSPKVWNYVLYSAHLLVVFLILFNAMILQIVYFGLCLPAFTFQFLPFMRRFKIQKVLNYINSFLINKILMESFFFLSFLVLVVSLLFFLI